MKANAIISSVLPTTPKTASKKRINPSNELNFVKNLPFRKRNGSVHYIPEYSLFPKNVGELTGAMRFSAQKKKRATFIPQGYSDSNMAPMADVLVYLQYFNNLRIDRTNHATLVLEAGVTLMQVEQLLSSTSFSLPINLNLGKTSFGIKAATSFYECLRSNSKSLRLIEWVEKVDVNGNVRRFDRRTDGERVIYEASQMMSKSGVVVRIGLRLKG